MNQARFWGFLPAFCLLAPPLLAQSSNELKLGAGAAKLGQVASVPLTLSTTDQVQGLVAAFEWDSALGTGAGLDDGPALAGADTVVKRVEAGYMVLGVVLDSNPNDAGSPEIIGPGNDLLVATAKIKCGGTEGTAAVSFVDAKYNTVDRGPVLDNLVVVGGLSIGAQEGLKLTNGSFECFGIRNQYSIADGAGNSGCERCGAARVLMDNRAPVEGYVVALCHDAGALTLDSIAVGAAAVAQAADFSASEIFAGGGTLGVVIDLQAPFTNNTIPTGEGSEVAVYRYCPSSVPERGQPGVTSALTFCDNVLGAPLKENVIVIGGLSVNPALVNGTYTTSALGSDEVCDNDVDDDCDGLTDCDDTADCPTGQPPCGLPPSQMFACGSRKGSGTVEGSIGTAVEVCFFYKSPEDNAVGHAQPDHIQGFSMALTYCCDVSARESFDISGTIVEAVGAEFVSIQADNDPGDGDGCELIIGVLVDALPPFDGATLPPTETLARVGCVTFLIKDDPALCGKCCPIEFTDGVNGRGKVPIKNLISVENVSVSVKDTSMPCEICIVEKERFFRGDCNFSLMGSMAVDIADAAAVVSFLFLPGTWKFQPPCLDACDCNDDGRIDLADAVCILQYLFQFGRFPPAPGPGLEETGLPNPNRVKPSPPGKDPTPDKLDCAAGNQCI
ncbi:MAG: hypothetical protein HY721_18650 [Planctomycetes bacterium]|nr:hypothetical protein [Planctomycetota bacterium]